MNNGSLGLLAAACLLAASACWIACDSAGSDDSALQAQPPPGGGPPLPTSSEGWTVLTPSSDTRAVYVSSSTGNDANDGLTSATPKATLTAGLALLRDGMPDWLHLKAGDIWTNQDMYLAKSGRSTLEPMVITSYDTGARPLIQSGSDSAIVIQNAPVAHLAIVGLHLRAHLFTGNGAPTGIMVLANCDDILVEDCFIESYKDNIVILTANGPPGSITNFRVRRCVIVDSFCTVAHAQGIFAAGVDGLLIEECVFDHNGYKPGVNGAEETIFNHNMYIQSDCINVTIRGNISARASSHGLQLRPGGIVEENLYLRNAIAMFAAGEGAGPPQTRVVNNVVLDGKDIDGSPRGSGIEVFDSRNALVQNNVVAHKPPGVGTDSAFRLEGYKDDDPTVNYVIVFEDNIAYQWNGAALETADTYTSLTVRNNILQDLTLSQFMINLPAFHGFEVFQNNQYWSNRAASSWFRVGGSDLSLAGWVSATSETGAEAIQVTFPDAGRTIESYQTSLGMTPTLDAFLAEARLQSKSFWRPAYTAEAVNDYIRAGFGR
jgi:hypothetical protein